MLNIARYAPRPIAIPQAMSALVGLAALAASATVALASGYLVAEGYGEQLITLAVGLAAFIGILARPDFALIGWIAILFSYGADFARTPVGPVYVTEVFLAAVTAAVGLRLLFAPASNAALRLPFAISILLWLPAIAGVAINTNVSDPAWTRQFAIIHYSLFAPLAAALYSRRMARQFGIAVVVAALLAIAWNLAQGETGVTSTGAIRFAAGSQALGFAAALLILIAAFREGLVGRRSLLLALPLLAGLTFVSHRSAWIGFALAVTLLIFSRPGVTARLALAAGAGCLVLVLATAFVTRPTSPLGQLVARAESINDPNEPNAKYRREFWWTLIRASAHEPVFGAGFDPYPAEFVPKKTTKGDRDYAPHNSFIALAYRIGPLFLSAVAALLALVVFQGFRRARESDDPLRRAILSALSAIVVFNAVFAAFNVVLELPYMAVPFWTAVGLLAGALSETRASAAPKPL
jgi:hypothetical protein